MQSRLYLKRSEIISLGLLTFNFFFGAGNLIYPILSGYLAGTNHAVAILGFLLSAVGLPCLSLVTIARIGGFSQLIELFPNKTGKIFQLILLVLMGPLYVTPRTGVAAYEMGVLPLGLSHGHYFEAVFYLIFFSIALLLAFNKRKLVPLMGTILTPVLLGFLIFLIGFSYFAPLAKVGMPQAGYAVAPLSTALIEGYQTMDGLGGLLFGGLMTGILVERGIQSPKQQAKYIAVSGAIAGGALALVYIGLFRLGATGYIDGDAGVVTGGALLAQKSQAILGQKGLWSLAILVFLACVTTAAGIASACAEEFRQWFGWHYERTLVGLMLVIGLVANLGLTGLSLVARPLLALLYPIGITLMLISFLPRAFSRNSMVTGWVLGTALLTSLPYSLFQLFDFPLLNKWLSILPGGKQGTGWVLPTLGVMVFLSLTMRNKMQLKDLLSSREHI